MSAQISIRGEGDAPSHDSCLEAIRSALAELGQDLPRMACFKVTVYTDNRPPTIQCVCDGGNEEAAEGFLLKAPYAIVLASEK